MYVNLTAESLALIITPEYAKYNELDRLNG